MAATDPASDPRNHPVVIASQLAELHTVTVEGFAKLDGRIGKIEDTVSGHGERLTVLEVKDAVAAKIDWTKVLAVIGALAAAALGGHAAPF